MKTRILGKALHRLQEVKSLREGFIGRLIRDRTRLPNDFFIRYRNVPDTIAVENTSACNRRCPYCPHFWSPRPQGRMPFPVFDKILDDLRDLDFRGRIVMAPWGEAILDERLASWTTRTKEKLPRCLVEIQTNGDDLSLNAFRALAEAGVDEFHVSEHYAPVDGRYVLDEPKQAVRTYRGLSPQDRRKFHFDPRNRDRIGRSERFHNRSDLVPLRDSVSMASLCRYCDFVEAVLAINFRGDVLLCARQWTDRPSFGNVRNEHLADIWKKAEFRRVRQDLRNGRFLLPLCQSCGFGYLPDADELPG
jgi:radical SAM protein with 4Fe4S-binding SPASM domain